MVNPGDRLHYARMPPSDERNLQSNLVDEIKMEPSCQDALGSQCSSTQAQPVAGTTSTMTESPPQDDSYVDQVKLLTYLLGKQKEMSKTALVKQLTQLSRPVIEEARGNLFQQMEATCQAKCYAEGLPALELPYLKLNAILTEPKTYTTYICVPEGGHLCP